MNISKFFKKISPIASVLGSAYDVFAGERGRKDAKSQFAATSLTARVNEARRLGLSPLAVLGSPTSSPTIAATGQSQLGSQLKDIMSSTTRASRYESPLDKRVKAAAAQRDEAAAAEHLSNVSRLSQPGLPQPPPQSTEWQDPCPPNHLYCRRYDPISKQEVWHPNLRHWPELGEIAGAGAVGKSKTSPKEPYTGNLGTRYSRRKRKRGAAHLR